MKCPFKIKVCRICKRILVANILNFKKRKDSKDGLRNECKKCCNEEARLNKEINKKIKENNPFINIDIDKVWNHCPYCIKICTDCKEILVANEINFYKKVGKKHRLESNCKKCYNRKAKEYNFENAELRKEYRENHKERKREYDKKYRENNPDKCFNSSSKRRLLEENQGEGITKEQWVEMMEFFEWKCAYSGKYIGGKKNSSIRSIDHVIPLNNSGEHEIWNCVPMYRNYNSSKQTSDMLEWYKKQEFYSEKRLNKIYEWQEYAYNKWS